MPAAAGARSAQPMCPQLAAAAIVRRIMRERERRSGQGRSVADDARTATSRRSAEPAATRFPVLIRFDRS